MWELATTISRLNLSFKVQLFVSIVLYNQLLDFSVLRDEFYDRKKSFKVDYKSNLDG